MINPNCFIGIPILFKNEYKIYPPKIKEVLNNKDFSKYRNLLTITQEELEDEFLNKVDENGEPMKVPSPFEFLLINSYHNEEFLEIAKNAFSFFMKEEVTFLFEIKSILIGNIEEEVSKIRTLEDLNKLPMIKEEDYFDFQNIIRESLGEDKVERPNPNEDIRIKKIKAKARYRDKIKAKKNSGLSLSTSLIAICCMGIGITPLNIGEISYSAISSLIAMYQQKEKYEVDIKALIAGADSKKIKPKYWIKNLE